VGSKRRTNRQADQASLDNQEQKKTDRQCDRRNRPQSDCREIKQRRGQTESTRPATPTVQIGREGNRKRMKILGGGEADRKPNDVLGPQDRYENETLRVVKNRKTEGAVREKESR